MNKKIPLGATLALIIITMALTISVTMVVAMRYFNSNVTALAQKQSMFDNIADVDTAVRQQYANIDEAKLRAALAQAYISSIDDPYAAYLSHDAYTKAQAEAEGKMTGVGIDVTLSTEGKIIATLIHKDSAAEKAGMRKGDVITAVDGTEVKKEDFAAVKSKLENAAKVLVTVSRDGQPSSFELTASPYVLVSVEERVIGDSVGYIRIRGFHNNTTEQFKAAYSALEEAGVGSIIFDLRGNTGGTIQSAKDMLSYLLPRGKYASLTDNEGKVTELVAEDLHQMSVPTVTLVNGKTAGEAELFAGVLQEFQLTTVVGENTAGKGRIQEFFPLKVDSSAVKLTVAQLSLLQSGGLEGKGIAPTKLISLTESQTTDFELLTETTDPQLKAALSILTGGAATTPTEPTGGADSTATQATTTTAAAQ